jgi:TonB family protein
MISTRMMTLFVLLSLAGHVTVLSAAGFIGLYSGPPEEDMFQVELTAPVPEDRQSKKAISEEHKKTAGFSGLERYRGEDTVELGSSSRKYIHYLSRLRKQIESQWQYPPEAYAKKQTGTAVLQFSIGSSGSLLNSCILSSSGFEDLDSGALAVVKAAAPYAPLPDNFNLSRFHIIARFQYDIF